MFDLFRSRDKAVRLMLGGLLLVVAISMLTYLVPNYDTNGPTGNLVLATVGGEDIHAEEVQHMVQTAMRGKQLPPDMLPIYIPQMVDDIIVNRAMGYEAARLGFQVTDEQLRTAIMQMYPTFFPDGRFVGKDQYAAILAQQGGITPEQFESDLRRQILIARLRDVAVEGTVVTPLEIEQAYKTKYEKIKIQYVKLPSDKYKAEVTPSDAEMRSYYQANVASYQTPEKKNLVLLIADQAKIEQSINVPDDELRKMYNQNSAQYHVPEQATVRHILFMTQGKPPADEPKIKAQAEDVMNQIKSGKAKFEDMVQKYSEDPGSKDKGGVYPNLQRNGQMVKEFEDAAFTQKPGDLGLVKTSYGYHIVQVVSREPAHQQSFDEVKAAIASQAKKVRVNDILQRASDQAQSMLTKDPMHPEKVAADLGMQLVRADNVEAGKPIPEVGANPDFDQAVAALKVGQVTPAVALANNKVVVAQLASITPPKPTPFEEVKGKVTDAMLQFRLPAKVREKATELAQKAKASGSLEQAAKDMGFKVESTEGFIRTDTVNGFGSANYVSQGFTSPDGTILGPVLMPDATAVVKVVEHIPADMSKFAAERPTLRDQIKSQKAGDRDTLFRAGLKEKLIQEGKIKLHQDAINKLIAGYRSS
jgi:peptidyl-prolyl cis-trans isomerase D